MARRYAAGRNIAITNPLALSALLGAVVKEQYGGSVAAAARAKGIPRSLLRRIIAGRQASVRTDNVHRLRQLVGRRRQGEVEAALLDDAAQAKLAQYDEWLRAAGRFASFGGLGSNDGGVKSRAPTALGRSMALFSLQRRLRQLYPKEWSRLDRALRAKHYNNRAALAFARVVSPLVDHYDSGGIERDPREFTDAEMRAFIKAGVTREILLLNREPDPQRAQSNGPRTYGRSDGAAAGASRLGSWYSRGLAGPFDLLGDLAPGGDFWDD